MVSTLRSGEELKARTNNIKESLSVYWFTLFAERKHCVFININELKYCNYVSHQFFYLRHTSRIMNIHVKTWKARLKREYTIDEINVKTKEIWMSFKLNHSINSHDSQVYDSENNLFILSLHTHIICGSHYGANCSNFYFIYS